MKLSGLLFAAALLGSCTQPAAEENYTRHVDPKIGTGGHGHVFVGANVPFGLVQVGPTSIPQTWDWCSGYHASDSTVIGFSHTHLSGAARRMTRPRACGLTPTVRGRSRNPVITRFRLCATALRPS